MKASCKIKFPCGYEYYEELTTGIFYTCFVDTEKLTQECPLHGKKCPPKK